MCQFLVLAITTGKKKLQSSVWRVVLLCQFSVLAITTRKKKFAVVSVFGSGGKSAVFLLWRESFITTGKTKFQSSVWRVVLLCQFLVLAGNRKFFCCGGKVLLRPKKKDTVVCLAGAQSLLRPEKKVLVVCLAGARSLLRPEKKVLVICPAGARSLLRPEKKVIVFCLAGARSLLQPENKVLVVIFTQN